jgi:hypothetical protein
MGRRLIAAVMAAVIVFVWGFVAWTVLPQRWQAVQPMPEDSEVTSVLQDTARKSGVYMLPAPPHDASNPNAKPSLEAQNAYEERLKKGPSAMVFYRAEGTDPMDMMVYVKGFGLHFACACMVVAVVGSGARAGWGFAKRFLAVMLMAMFSTANSDLVQWNYWGYATPYTIYMAANTMIGWGVAGLFIAGMLKKPTPH